MPNKIEISRRKYKPKNIKLLFIAEAPPPEDTNRFFFFEKVDKQDSLFLQIMQVLYKTEYDTYRNTPAIRADKTRFLEKFKADGFYLIDAVETPLCLHLTSKQKENIIKDNLPALLNKLKDLAVSDSKIILISSTVYRNCAAALKINGFNVINTEMIDFPGSGGQKKFRDKLSQLLTNHEWL